MGFYVAPSKWEIQHAGQIFAGQQYAATHGGDLPDTPLWKMLEFRHALNERRFDHYHPNVGRILEMTTGSSLTTSGDVLHSWRDIMRGPTESILPTDSPIPSYGSSAGQDVSPPTSVPEPSAIVMLALAMVSAVLFAGFQRLRRGVRPNTFDRSLSQA